MGASRARRAARTCITPILALAPERADSLEKVKQPARRPHPLACVVHHGRIVGVQRNERDRLCARGLSPLHNPQLLVACHGLGDCLCAHRLRENNGGGQKGWCATAACACSPPSSSARLVRTASCQTAGGVGGGEEACRVPRLLAHLRPLLKLLCGKPLDRGRRIGTPRLVTGHGEKEQRAGSQPVPLDEGPDEKEVDVKVPPARVSLLLRQANLAIVVHLKDFIAAHAFDCA